MIGCEATDKLLGEQIANAWVGVGTFLVLDLTSSASGEIDGSIWIYLCDWAFVLQGEEILSSQNLDTKESLGQLVGLDFLGLSVVDEEEFHLDFSNGVRIEIWENDQVYGKNAEAVKLYKQDVHLGSIFF